MSDVKTTREIVESCISPKDMYRFKSNSQGEKWLPVDVVRKEIDACEHRMNTKFTNWEEEVITLKIHLGLLENDEVRTGDRNLPYESQRKTDSGIPKTSVFSPKKIKYIPTKKKDIILKLEQKNGNNIEIKAKKIVSTNYEWELDEFGEKDEDS